MIEQKDQVEVHETPKHLPARKDAQKTDLIDDPMDELKKIKAEAREGLVDTAHKGEGDEGGALFRESSVDLLDRNQLTDQDILDLVEDAKRRIDSTLLELDPSLAFRSALDLALSEADRKEEEFSPFDLVDPYLYSRILATLAGEYGFEVEQEGVEPSNGREVHLTGIDLIEDARNRVSSIYFKLASRQRYLREQIANFDAYVQRLQQAPEQTEIVREVGRRGLVDLDQRINEELLKLSEYQRKLREALKREVDQVFQADLGVSPVVKIVFSDVMPTEAVAGEDVWVLDFSVTLEEVFDPKIDRRIELSPTGEIISGDVDALLREAGNRIRRKLNIIRHCFEKFLGGQIDVDSNNTLYGSATSGMYRAFAKFQFRINVPVKGVESIRLITVAIADALEDLMNAEYGRLASRSRSTLADWYKTAAPVISPAMKQYYKFRKKYPYPEYTLLFQMGDFFEVFDADAKRLASDLGISLTERVTKRGRGDKMLLSGFPLRYLDQYLRKLAKKGRKVVVAEQVQGKSGLKREVTRVITPGMS